MLSNSITDLGDLPQFMYTSNNDPNSLVHERPSLLIKDSHLGEMAPNFINNKLYKDSLTPKFYNNPLNYQNNYDFSN